MSDAVQSRSTASEPALAACPFCTSETVHCCFGLGATYLVECQSCEASGPRAMDRSTAIDAWNRHALTAAQREPEPTKEDLAKWSRVWHDTCDTIVTMLGMPGSGSPQELLAQVQAYLDTPPVQDAGKGEAVAWPLDDRQLWENGCITRAQVKHWTDEDISKHSVGMRKTVQFLLARLDALAAAPQPASNAYPAWQPIETAPKDGTPVLVGFPGHLHAMSGHHEDGFWGQLDSDFGFEHFPTQPTHWMWLPDSSSISSTDRGGK